MNKEIKMNKERNFVIGIVITLFVLFVLSGIGMLSGNYGLYNGTYGMMNTYYGGFGFMWIFGFLIMVLFIIALILFIIWIINQLNFVERRIK